jgi:hypothetical protein
MLYVNIFAIEHEFYNDNENIQLFRLFCASLIYHTESSNTHKPVNVIICLFDGV